MSKTAWIKLALLSDGVTTAPSFDDWLAEASGFVRRRNFYNSPDWNDGRSTPLPQEVRLLGDQSVTVAVNPYPGTQWQLVHDDKTGPAVVSERLGVSAPVELIRDLNAIQMDESIARVCNLYGGSALSFFSPRSCYFFSDGTECRFCSLDGTAKETSSFAARVLPDQVRAAIKGALATDADALTQVMIVGGNERNLDRGFRHQVELVRAAAEELTAAGAIDRVSVHLIVMPPHDLGLIDQLAEIPNLHAGFNLEVWDDNRFTEIAPGKTHDYGHQAIRTALGRLRDAVGPYRAHSILIAGLEPAPSTLDGARQLASEGISPIINTYHSDRHSALGLSIRPTYRHLAEVAAGLQDLYDAYEIQPYWKGCGRNALDFEARHGMFRDGPMNLS
jgi:hypothetical protein